MPFFCPQYRKKKKRKKASAKGIQLYAGTERGAVRIRRTKIEENKID